MSTVASHGDFVNRKLLMPNSELLRDDPLRKRLEIELEVYDEALSKYIDRRCSDVPPPLYWHPSSPQEAMAAGVNIIHVLVHPRNWRTDLRANIADNTNRLIEVLRYR